MQIETGLVVVFTAVLIFYRRLIIIQRARVRNATLKPQPPSKKKKRTQANQPSIQLSILSPNKRDRIIAAAGFLLILIGVLLKIRFFPVSVVQIYWWIPVAVGIVAFSWGFK